MSRAAAAPFRHLASSLIGGALAGKLLGFVRELMMAHAFGVSIVADSFRGALTAVLLPLSLLQGDTVPAVLIPLHRQWQAEGQAPQRFAALTAALSLTALAIMAAVEALAGPWVRVIVGGFSPDALLLTRRFVQVMAFAMPGSVLFNCLISVELSLGRARLTSIRASVQNVGIMLGLAFAAATGEVIAIAWCFAAAFTLTAGWGTWALWREGEMDLRAIRPGTALQAYAAFLRRMRAVVAQPLADQGQVWLERTLASASASGTVAALDYARALTESAVFIVSQPVGLAVLADARRDGEAARLRLMAIARPLLILAMPASAFLVLFARDVVQVVFARGAFAEKGLLLTSDALAGIGAGLWAATLGWILIRQLNREGRNGRAAWVLVQAYGANAAFNLAFSSRLGAVGFGLGEAARSVVLLAGTALAVGCGSPVLRVALQVLPACAGLWLASVVVHACVASALGCVALGALAYCAVVGVTGAALMPAACRTALARVAQLIGSKSIRVAGWLS